MIPMRKIAAISAAGLFSVSVLAGCSSSESPENDESTISETSEDSTEDEDSTEGEESTEE